MMSGESSHTETGTLVPEHLYKEVISLNKPLEGIRVIDSTFFVAGPSCGKTLAEWGAEVIKVEPPKGDPVRIKGLENHDFYYGNYNANKKGIIIDSKTEEGAKLMDELIATADVFLTSYRTKALVKLGLDYETLSRRYPKLIYAQITGYGDEGPDADLPGFDTAAYWARSGLMSDFVEPGSNIVNPPVGFGDLSAGAVMAGGIGAALYAREKTGKGDKVMLSLYGLSIFCLNYAVTEVQNSGVYPKTRLEPTFPLMNSFKCKDGKWIYMSILDHDRYYPVLMKLIDREDLVDHPVYKTIYKAYTVKKELTQILDEGFLRYTQEEWAQKLTEADIAFSVVRQVKDILTDEQAIENGYLQSLTYRDGTTNQFAAGPVKFGDTTLEPLRNAPRLEGEDTVEIMESLHYSRERIKELADKKVVRAIWKDGQ